MPASLLAEQKRIQAMQEKESKMIQMLSLMNPTEAENLKKQAKVYKLDVIRVSGPGFVTKTTLEYLQQQTPDDT